jgi:hypothetical protein
MTRPFYPHEDSDEAECQGLTPERNHVNARFPQIWRWDTSPHSLRHAYAVHLLEARDRPAQNSTSVGAPQSVYHSPLPSPGH